MSQSLQHEPDHKCTGRGIFGNQHPQGPLGSVLQQLAGLLGQPIKFGQLLRAEFPRRGVDDTQGAEPPAGLITPQTRKGPLTFSAQILHLSKPPKFSDPATEDVSFESSLQSPLHVESPDPRITQKLLTASTEKLPTGLSPDLDRIINALKGKEAFLEAQFACTDRLLETIEGRQEDLAEKMLRLAAVLRTPVDV